MALHVIGTNLMDKSVVVLQQKILPSHAVHLFGMQAHEYQKHYKEEKGEAKKRSRNKERKTFG